MRPLMMIILLVFGATLVHAQPDSALIYVPSPETESVLVIDPESASVTESIELGSQPVALVAHPDNDLVYVVTREEDTLIVLEDNAVADTIDLDSPPVDITLDPETNLLTISFEGTDGALILDVETLEPVADAGPIDTSSTGEIVDLLLPSYPLCPLSADADRESFQTNLTPNLIDLQCRILAENGEFIQPAAEIGVQDVIELGVIHAIELFSPSGINAERIDVCLRGTGHIIYLDAEDQPRVANYLQRTVRSGYTCTQLPGLGTLILVR